MSYWDHISVRSSQTHARNGIRIDLNIMSLKALKSQFDALHWSSLLARSGSSTFFLIIFLNHRVTTCWLESNINTNEQGLFPLLIVNDVQFSWEKDSCIGIVVKQLILLEAHIHCTYAVPCLIRMPFFLIVTFFSGACTVRNSTNVMN